MAAPGDRQPVPAGVAPAWKERRGQPRIDLHLPIAYHEVAVRPPATRHGTTVDVSRAGVRFRSEESLSPGAFLALEVSLPARGTCIARGRAVWVRKARGDGGWEVGAEFLRSSGDDAAALAEALVLAT
jgi:hypothetical protein